MTAAAKDPADVVVPARSLTLLTTFRCNFRCAHCGYRCGPRRDEVIPRADALAWIQDAAEIETIATVALSGGEPFLFPDLVRDLVRRAGQLGLDSAVVSNAFWARTEAEAIATLGPLVDEGLADFTTSFDTFHRSFVSADRLRNAVRASLRLGLTVHVNVTVSRRGDVTVHDAVRALELDESEIAPCNGAGPGTVELKELSPIRVGAAEDHLADEDLIRFDRALLEGHGCPLVLAHPVVTPVGEVHACCGFGGATDRGPSRLTRVGNLHERSLRAVLRGMAHDLLLNLIHMHGPYGVIRLLREQVGGLRTRRRYVFNCEVCHEIVCRPTLQRRLADVLETLAVVRSVA